MSMDEFNSEIAKRLNVDKISWLEYYLKNLEPIEEMQKLLIWAGEKYKVGLMTNIMPGFISAMRREHKLPDINLEAIVDSSEAGTIKPEEKIYRIAEQKAGVDPHEILLIDDDRVNLMAAEKLGWHVLWFDDSHSEESTERIRKEIEPAD